MTTRLALPNRRNPITQKVKVAGQRTLYLSVHDDDQPAEIFLRLKGSDCSSELIGLYDVIARLISVALQYGAPLEKVGDLLAGAKFALCGPVAGHDHIKSCTSLPDLIGRHLLVEYCGREDLAHVSASVKDSEHPLYYPLKCMTRISERTLQEEEGNASGE
jgi:ribonucleoside-diphosphate reductase alpha chain